MILESAGDMEVVRADCLSSGVVLDGGRRAWLRAGQSDLDVAGEGVGESVMLMHVTYRCIMRKRGR